jgi:predicted dehydrogenase
MRVLVVGYGSIARRHVENLRALEAVREFVILRPAGRPEDAPEDLLFVQHIQQALERKPELAIVASPSASHMESLLPLLEARIPCYVEKPPVTSAEDVTRLRQLESLPVTLTGCNLRFLPSLRRLRDALHSGSVGTPVRASLQAGQWLPDWRPGRDYRSTYSARAQSGGGVIFDLIHEIDAARWLFGEFDQVRSMSAKSSRLAIDAEDSAGILLGRRGGPLVSIGLDYIARPPIRRYEIFGDEGTLIWDLRAQQLTRGEEVLESDPRSFDLAASYRAAMAEFLSAIKQGRAASPDLADGLNSTDLALRARGEPW